LEAEQAIVEAASGSGDEAAGMFVYESEGSEDPTFSEGPFIAPPGPPRGLCCPISMEIMKDPVVAADFFTYDRAFIEQWFARGKRTSPTTNARLESTVLTPNHLAKSQVAEFLSENGDAAP